LPERASVGKPIFAHDRNACSACGAFAIAAAFPRANTQAALSVIALTKAANPIVAAL